MLLEETQGHWPCDTRQTWANTNRNLTVPRSFCSRTRLKARVASCLTLFRSCFPHVHGELEDPCLFFRHISRSSRSSAVPSHPYKHSQPHLTIIMPKNGRHLAPRSTAHRISSRRCPGQVSWSDSSSGTAKHHGHRDRARQARRLDATRGSSTAALLGNSPTLLLKDTRAGEHVWAS